MRIERHNDRTTYIIGLFGFTAAFIFLCSSLIPPIFWHPFAPEELYILPAIAFLIVWCVMALRIGIWRAFGVEQLVVERGALSWTRTALCWVRKVEIPTADVIEIKANKPWHALSNHVELIARNRRHRIGDMLLQDETTELAEQLRHAVGLAE